MNNAFSEGLIDLNYFATQSEAKESRLHLLGPASYHASVEKPQKFVQNSIFYNV
jgi:hypothetical protein